MFHSFFSFFKTYFKPNNNVTPLEQQISTKKNTKQQMKPPQTSSTILSKSLDAEKSWLLAMEVGKKKKKKKCVISTRSQNRRTKLFDSDQPARLFKNAKYEGGCLTLCFAFKGARRWTHHLPPQHAASSAR